MKDLIKNITITALVTGILAFVAGMNYEHSIAERVEKAAKASATPVVTPAPILK